MRRKLLAALFAYLFLSAVYHSKKPLPEGISYSGEPRPAEDVRFISDVTYVDPDGIRQVEQRIFDEILGIVRGARQLVVLDMFLFNDFQGATREETRALSTELTEALIARKRVEADLEIVLITDPINTVYGGLPSEQFARLREAGVQIVVTDLDRLRDSNPAYSTLWRLFVRPFGKGGPGPLPNPFGAGRVSFRTYLRLLNFKANHRKVLVADSPGGWTGLVTSGNPHDASSAHGNVAVRFDGPAVGDLLETERSVATFANGHVPDAINVPSGREALTVQVLTEGKIGSTLDEELAHVAAGDELAVAVFYLSDRSVVRSLVRAHERGVRVRVVLDPNKDAFGLEKNGIPNRPVAAELVRAGIPVRWCDTNGEQCHAKLLLLRNDDRVTLIAGSANFTRRNLRDYNLETSIAVRGPRSAPVMRDAQAYFERIWSNDSEHRFTVSYEKYADSAWSKRWLYRLSETTGIGTY